VFAVVSGGKSAVSEVGDDFRMREKIRCFCS